MIEDKRSLLQLDLDDKFINTKKYKFHNKNCKRTDFPAIIDNLKQNCRMISFTIQSSANTPLPSQGKTCCNISKESNKKKKIK